METRPTKDEALQFALMLRAGMPAAAAIQYFFPEEEDLEKVKKELKQWSKSKMVSKAIETVQGKPWVDMSLDEQMKFCIDKHYAELAYYLYSHNYNDLTGIERQKADICRQTLEAKLSGSIGKMTALELFYKDIMSGTTKLPALPS